MIYRHRVTIRNATPFILNQNADMPLGKQIRGMVGYVILSMDLKTANYFADPKDERVVFKNPHVIDDHSLDIRAVQYRNRDGTFSVCRVLYSSHRFCFDVFTKGRRAAKDINRAFEFLMKTDSMYLGRGRSHGFGKFIIDDYSFEEFDMGERVKVKTLRVVSTDPFFVRRGLSVQEAILESFRRFYAWMDTAFKPSTRLSLTGSVRLVREDARVNLYLMSRKKPMTIEGRLFRADDPMEIQFNRPVEICSAMDQMWGLGNMVHFGYGGFSFVS